MSEPEKHPSGLGWTCPDCDGDEGTIVCDEWVNCEWCDGQGYVYDEPESEPQGTP